MGDQQDGDVEALLEIGEEVEDLRLDRDVERGGRLVGDEQLGFACQGHGDEHALAHPAGHLERVLLDALAGLAMPTMSSSSTERADACLAAHLAVAAEHLDHLAADGEHRVERRHRVLEDHGDLAAADRSTVAAALPWTNDSPFQRTSPPTIRPGSSIIPSSAWAVTLLPEPDSPTSPRVSPLPIVKLTSRTAWTVPGGS